MAHFYGEVTVVLKPVVNDPQGLVVRDGLHQLGFSTVDTVRVGKHIELEFEAVGEVEAAELVHAMCDKLLSNGVIEEYRVSINATGFASSAAKLPLS